jgi:hypothetical protein
MGRAPSAGRAANAGGPTPRPSDWRYGTLSAAGRRAHPAVPERGEGGIEGVEGQPSRRERVERRGIEGKARAAIVHQHAGCAGSMQSEPNAYSAPAPAGAHPAARPRNLGPTSTA